MTFNISDSDIISFLLKAMTYCSICLLETEFNAYSITMSIFHQCIIYCMN